MKKYLMIILLQITLLGGMSWSQAIPMNSENDSKIESTISLNEKILAAFDNIPLKGITPAGEMIIELDPFTEWNSFLMQTFYTMGAADQIKELTPQIKIKETIINEKDKLILSYVVYKDEAEKTIVVKNKSIFALNIKVSEKDEEVRVWKNKFWIATGIGVVTTAFAIASLMF